MNFSKYSINYSSGGQKYHLNLHLSENVMAFAREKGRGKKVTEVITEIMTEVLSQPNIGSIRKNQVFTLKNVTNQTLDYAVDNDEDLHINLHPNFKNPAIQFTLKEKKLELKEGVKKITDYFLKRQEASNDSAVQAAIEFLKKQFRPIFETINRLYMLVTNRQKEEMEWRFNLLQQVEGVGPGKKVNMAQAASYCAQLLIEEQQRFPKKQKENAVFIDRFTQLERRYNEQAVLRKRDITRDAKLFRHYEDDILNAIKSLKTDAAFLIPAGFYFNKEWVDFAIEITKESEGDRYTTKIVSLDYETDELTQLFGISKALKNITLNELIAIVPLLIELSTQKKVLRADLSALSSAISLVKDIMELGEFSSLIKKIPSLIKTYASIPFWVLKETVTGKEVKKLSEWREQKLLKEEAKTDKKKQELKDVLLSSSKTNVVFSEFINKIGMERFLEDPSCAINEYPEELEGLSGAIAFRAIMVRLKNKNQQTEDIDLLPSTTMKSPVNSWMLYLKTRGKKDSETFEFAAQMKAMSDILDVSDQWLEDPFYRTEILMIVKKLRGTALGRSNTNDPAVAVDELKKIDQKLKRYEDKIKNYHPPSFVSKVKGFSKLLKGSLVLPNLKRLPSLKKTLNVSLVSQVVKISPIKPLQMPSIEEIKQDIAKKNWTPDAYHKAWSKLHVSHTFSKLKEGFSHHELADRLKDLQQINDFQTLVPFAPEKAEKALIHALSDWNNQLKILRDNEDWTRLHHFVLEISNRLPTHLEYYVTNQQSFEQENGLGEQLVALSETLTYTASRLLIKSYPDLNTDPRITLAFRHIKCSYAKIIQHFYPDVKNWLGTFFGPLPSFYHFNLPIEQEKWLMVDENIEKLKENPYFSDFFQVLADTKSFNPLKDGIGSLDRVLFFNHFAKKIAVEATLPDSASLEKVRCKDGTDIKAGLQALVDFDNRLGLLPKSVANFRKVDLFDNLFITKFQNLSGSLSRSNLQKTLKQLERIKAFDFTCKKKGGEYYYVLSEQLYLFPSIYYPFSKSREAFVPNFQIHSIKDEAFRTALEENDKWSELMDPKKFTERNFAINYPLSVIKLQEEYGLSKENAIRLSNVFVANPTNDVDRKSSFCSMGAAIELMTIPEMFDSPHVARYLEAQGTLVSPLEDPKFFLEENREIFRSRVKASMKIMQDIAKQQCQEALNMRAATMYKVQDALSLIQERVGEEVVFPPCDSIFPLISAEGNDDKKGYIAKEYLVALAKRKKEGKQIAYDKLIAAHCYLSTNPILEEKYAEGERALVEELMTTTLPIINETLSHDPRQVIKYLTTYQPIFAKAKIIENKSHFPQYCLQLDGVEYLFDVEQGLLLSNGYSVGQLPVTVINDSRFLSLFSIKEKNYPWELRLAQDMTGKGVFTYRSKRYPGYQITVTPSDKTPIRFYREITVKGKKKTVELVTFNAYEHDLNNSGVSFKGKRDFPRHLSKVLGKCSFWIDPASKQNEIYVMKENVLWGFLRIERMGRRAKVKELQRCDHSYLLSSNDSSSQFLQQISGLEEIDKIRIWGQKSRVDCVEYPTLCRREGEVWGYQKAKHGKTDGFESLGERGYFLQPKGILPRIPGSLDIESNVLPVGFLDFHLLENHSADQKIILAPQEYRKIFPQQTVAKQLMQIMTHQVAHKEVGGEAELWEKRFAKVPFSLDEQKAVFSYSVNATGQLESATPEGDLYLAYLFFVNKEYGRALDHLKLAERLPELTDTASEIYHWFQNWKDSSPNGQAFLLHTHLYYEGRQRSAATLPSRAQETVEEKEKRLEDMQEKRKHFLSRFGSTLQAYLDHKVLTDKVLHLTTPQLAVVDSLYQEIFDEQIAPKVLEHVATLPSLQETNTFNIEQVREEEKVGFENLLWIRAKSENHVNINSLMKLKSPMWLVDYFPQIYNRIVNGDEKERRQWEAAILAYPVGHTLPIPSSLIEMFAGKLTKNVMDFKTGMQFAQKFLLAAIKRKDNQELPEDQYDIDSLKDLKNRPSVRAERYLYFAEESLVDDHPLLSSKRFQKVIVKLAALPRPNKAVRYAIGLIASIIAIPFGIAGACIGYPGYRLKNALGKRFPYLAARMSQCLRTDKECSEKLYAAMIDMAKKEKGFTPPTDEQIKQCIEHCKKLKKELGSKNQKNLQQKIELLHIESDIKGHKNLLKCLRDRKGNPLEGEKRRQAFYDYFFGLKAHSFIAKSSTIIDTIAPSKEKNSEENPLFEEHARALFHQEENTESIKPPKITELAEDDESKLQHLVDTYRRHTGKSLGVEQDLEIQDQICVMLNKQQKRVSARIHAIEKRLDEVSPQLFPFRADKEKPIAADPVAGTWVRDISTFKLKPLERERLLPLADAFFSDGEHLPLSTRLGEKHQQATKEFNQYNPLQRIDIDKNSLEQIQETLEKELSKAETSQKNRVSELVALLHPQKDERHLARRFGQAIGRDIPPSIERLIGLWQRSEITQSDLNMLGLEETMISPLHVQEQIQCFILQSIKISHLKLCGQKIDQAINAFSVEGKPEDQTALLEAHKLLYRKREFNAENPNFRTLLMMEYHNGFLLRSDQVDISQEMLNNKNFVAELPMGAGKSKVIIPTLLCSLCNGKNLVTLIVPDALFAINRKDLGETAKRIYGQNLCTFEFDLSRESHREALEQQYLRLLEAIDNKEFILTTKTSMLGYRNFFISLLEEYRAMENPYTEEGEQLLKRIGVMAKTLKLFQERGQAICDEFHEVHDVKKEVNTALEMMRENSPKIPKIFQKTAVEIFKMIVSDKDFRELSEALQKNTQMDMEPEKQQKVLVQIAEKMLETINVEKGVVSQQAWIHYLRGKKIKDVGEQEAIMNHVAKLREQDPEKWEKIAALKGLISEALCFSFEKAGNRHYGRYGLYTIPYKGSNLPNIGSEFDKEVEKLAFTLQDYLLNGISEELFLQIVSNFLISAKTEASKKKISLDETAAAKKFKDLVEALDDPFLSSSLAQFNERNVNIYVNAFNRSPLSKITFCEQAVLPTISVLNRQVRGNPQHFAELFSHMGGCTGTNWSPHSYSDKIRKTQPSNSTSHVIGKTYSVLEELYSKNLLDIKLIQVDPDHASAALIHETGYLEEGKVLIDAGAYLKGIENEAFVEDALAEVSRKKLEIDGAIYVNKSGELVYKAIDKDKAVPLNEAPKVDPKRRLMLYDEPRCTGTDVKHHPKEKAYVTISADTTTTQAFQAFWRMRQLNTGQSLTFVLSEEVGDLITKGEKRYPSWQEILAFLRKNEAAKEGEYNFTSEIQKINSHFSQRMLVDIVQLASKDLDLEALGYLVHKKIAAFSKYFVDTKTEEDLLTGYAAIKSEEEPGTVLKEMANDNAEAFRKDEQAYQELEEAEAAAVALEEREYLDEALLPQTVPHTVRGTHVQVEQQVEQQQQVELATEMLVEQMVCVNSKSSNLRVVDIKNKVEEFSFKKNHFWLSDHRNCPLLDHGTCAIPFLSLADMFDAINNKSTKEQLEAHMSISKSLGYRILFSPNLYCAKEEFWTADSPKISKIFFIQNEDKSWYATGISEADKIGEKELNQRYTKACVVGINSQTKPTIYLPNERMELEDYWEWDLLSMEDKTAMADILVRIKFFNGMFTFPEETGEREALKKWLNQIAPVQGKTSHEIALDFLHQHILPKLSEESQRAYEWSDLRHVLEPHAFNTEKVS